MKKPLLRIASAPVLALACAAAQAQAEPAQTRGQLLYTTHCIACHDAQVHWRDKRAATDWASLKAQVRRWQASSGLGWNEADITEVARHLNDSFYRYPQTGDRLSLGLRAP